MKHFFIVILLTLITQMGGLVWIVVFGCFKYTKSMSPILVITLLEPLLPHLGLQKVLRSK
ncbi:hypothetical protein CW736_02335 [Nonlabens sp. MB-3u-79]|nr:hypothetical protein CW736_02335 [Nonlabens sp. MB-3u-79]